MISLILAALVTQGSDGYQATIQTCHDGDTCTVDVRVPVAGWGVDMVFHEDTRFCGINAPELRTPTTEAGKASRDYLLGRIKAAKVVLWRTYQKSGKVQRDKYGRLLGWLILDGVNMNDELVQKGLAAAYALDCT